MRALDADTGQLLCSLVALCLMFLLIIADVSTYVCIIVMFCIEDFTDSM